MKNRVVLYAFLFAGLFSGSNSSAFGQVGTFLGQVNFSQFCAPRTNGSAVGVGITFDGANLWFSCYDSRHSKDTNHYDLFKADAKTGNVLGHWDIVGGMGALAYDPNRNVIWAGEGGGISTVVGKVIEIPLDAKRNVSGPYQIAFSVQEAYCSPPGGCGTQDIVDGLAIDSINDILYVHYDFSTEFEGYTASTGAFLQFIQQAPDIPAGTPVITPQPGSNGKCVLSGLAMGGSTFFEGSDYCDYVWAVNTGTLAEQTSASFSIASSVPSGFDEKALTCDTNTFPGKDAIWVNGAFTPGALAFQIPDGSCGVGGQTATGSVALSPSSLTFSNQLVGTTSAAQPVTLTNSRTTALNITNIAITGTNPGDFAQTNNCGTGVAAGASCTINVTFTPSATGTRVATLSVTDDASNSPQTASLSGTGIGPVSLSPSSLTFPAQILGTTSAAQAITLTNSQNKTLNISSITIAGTNNTDFTQTNNCGATLAANSSCAINVTFTPSATGSRTATLSVTDDASNSPQTAGLSGSGTAPGTAPAIVQVQNNINITGTLFTSFTVPITTTGGDLLVAFARESSSGTDNFTVTDSAGQTWTQTSSGYSNVSDAGPRSGMFFVANSAAVTSVTVRYSTAGGVGKPGIMVMEISGAAASAVADGSVNHSSLASVTASTSGALTTTNANDILIFATDTGGNETGWTAGAGYSIPNNKDAVGASGSNARQAMQFAVVSSVQTGATTSLTYVNTNWNANVFAAFKGGTSSSSSPAASLLPSSLTFAGQAVGTSSAAQTVTLSNTGSATLNISSIAIAGTNAADFAQTNNCGTSLGAGANCAINVTFTPSATGTRAATLTVTDNASNSPQTASLTGTGTAPPSLSPSSLTFASQNLGTTSAAQAVTLSNTQTTALSITSIAITGTNPGDFAETNNCGTSVAAGASCTINVTFAPTATGSRTATLTVTDNASNSPQTASLSGTGAALPGLSPSSLTFGNQAVGTTSAAQAVTLSNPQSVALNLTSIGFTGANPGDFAQSNNCGTSVAAGGSCTINVTFTPTATGGRTAALTVTDDASNSPQTAGLAGTGVAPVSLSPPSLTFSNQNVGTTSAAQPATLTNAQPVALVITGIAVTGTNAGDFVQRNNCGALLGANSSCTISVTFTPSATGVRTATLTVTDDASNSPQTAGLTGTGTTPSAALAVAQVQNNIDMSGTAFTSFSVPVTTTPGSLLVAFARESSNATDNFTVTDSAGQTWTQTSSGYANESNSGPRSGMFYIANSAAVTSVTVNFTTTGGVIKPGIMVMEISGGVTSGVTDGSVNHLSLATTTASTSSALTTTNANDILIFATDTSGNETGWTAGAGYTIPNNGVAVGASGSNVRMAMQFAIVSSVQTNVTTSMTYLNSNWNGNIFAAFK